ncbi:hypothetical protein D3C77_541500 [compost metagenome]
MEHLPARTGVFEAIEFKRGSPGLADTADRDRCAAQPGARDDAAGLTPARFGHLPRRQPAHELHGALDRVGVEVGHEALQAVDTALAHFVPVDLLPDRGDFQPELQHPPRGAAEHLGKDSGQIDGDKITVRIGRVGVEPRKIQPPTCLGEPAAEIAENETRRRIARRVDVDAETHE